MTSETPFPETANSERPFPETVNSEGPFPETANSERPFPETTDSETPFPETAISEGPVLKPTNSKPLFPQAATSEGPVVKPCHFEGAVVGPVLQKECDFDALFEGPVSKPGLQKNLPAQAAATLLKTCMLLSCRKLRYCGFWDFSGGSVLKLGLQNQRPLETGLQNWRIKARGFCKRTFRPGGFPPVFRT